MRRLLAVIAILVVSIAYSAVRILREYERGVVFTLGRYTGTKGPGFFLLVPIAQQMVRIDLRIVVLDVPSQDVISRDNVSVKVNAVLYFRVVDSDKAVMLPKAERACSQPRAKGRARSGMTSATRATPTANSPPTPSPVRKRYRAKSPKPTENALRPVKTE